MRPRLPTRSAIIGVAALAHVAVTAGTAAAGTSTFAGGSYTSCSKPPAPALGSSTGNGLCTTTANAGVCVTAVDAGEAAVVANCTADLVAATSLFFVQFRAEQNGPVEIHCFGTGNGVLRYRPTGKASYMNIPVTVSVQDTAATFSGVSLAGTSVAIVIGSYTSACGGFGEYAGEVL